MPTEGFIRMHRWTALLAVAAFAFAGMASAQIANSNAPIDITADSAEVVNSQCMAIWRGSAEALQGQTRLRADTIKVYSQRRGNTCGATRRIEAEGGVFYVTPTQTARGDRATYDAGAATIVITGNVIIVQGRNVARGDRLTINVNTRQAQMDSNSHGRGTPNRVRGVFYPGTMQPEAPAQ
jgi:lipopolysaccharide export system protein LptA